MSSYALMLRLQKLETVNLSMSLKSLLLKLRKICSVGPQILRIWSRGLFRNTITSFLSTWSLRRSHLQSLIKLHTAMMYQLRLLKKMLFYLQFIYLQHTMAVICGIFPYVFRLADIAPIHKQKSKLDNANYRSVTLLLNISQISEKCTHRLILNYIEKISKIYWPL